LKIHIVQKGDTLWELAKEYDVDFEELKQLNSHLSSPDMIMPGMKIKIPSTKKPVKQEFAKEMGKKEKTIPYKDTSPKPMPVLKEDDKKEKKKVIPEFPTQSLPQIPVMPFPADYESEKKPEPEKPKTPKMKQEVKNYTMIHLPPAGKTYHKPEESSESSESMAKTDYGKEHGAYMHEKDQQPYMPSYTQPVYQQMPPMMPMYYPVYQPCPPPVYPPMPMFDPMFYQQGPPMHINPHDCGCSGTANYAPFQPAPDMYTAANPSYMEAPTKMPSLPKDLSANFFKSNDFSYRDDLQKQDEPTHFSSQNNEGETESE